MSLQISERPNKLSTTDDDTKRSPSKGITSKITNYVIFILISEVCLAVYLHRYMDKQYKEIRSNFVHKSEIENYFLTLFESNSLKDELSAEILEKIRRETILSRTKRQNYVYMGCNCETKREPLQSNPAEPAVRVPMVIPGPVGPPLGAYIDPNEDVFGNQRARLGAGGQDLQNDDTGFQPGAIGMQHGKIYPPIITEFLPSLRGLPSLTGEASELLKKGEPGPEVNRNEFRRMALKVGNMYRPGPIGATRTRKKGIGKDIFEDDYETFEPATLVLMDIPPDGTLKEGFSEETSTLQEEIHSLPEKTMGANKADNTVSQTGVNVRPQPEDTLSYPNSPLST